MVVEAQITKYFKQAFDNLQSQKQRIVKEKIDLLANNPRHPSLNVHRVRRSKSSIWECYIDDSMRLLYEIQKGILHLWDLGGHAIVDNVHLRTFTEQTHFSTWNITTVATTSAVETTEPTAESIVPTELFLETHDVTESGTLNYFAYYRVARLRVLGVPEELVQSLKDAPSLEDALALPGLPEKVRLSLMDLSTSPELVGALLDPSLLLYRTTLDRLEGYFEGKIKKLMLNLEPEQQQYIDMDHIPIFLLKGVAGSGKTTIGIYRAIRMAKQGRQVLLLVYNQILSTSIKNLIIEINGQLPENLEVRTLHSLMAKALGRRLNIPKKGEPQPRAFLREALVEVRSKNSKINVLSEYGESFFEVEISRVIKGHGITSFQEYKDFQRYGRKTGLKEKQREVVWQVYEAYQRRLGQAGRNDWSDASGTAFL